MTREKILEKALAAQRKFLKYAAEDQHGLEHQQKWFRMAITAGVDHRNPPAGYDSIYPGTLRGMSVTEVQQLWEQHGRNKRWTYALNWYRGYLADEEKRQHEYKKTVPSLEELRAAAPPSLEEWLAAGRTREDYEFEYGGR